MHTQLEDVPCQKTKILRNRVKDIAGIGQIFSITKWYDITYVQMATKYCDPESTCRVIWWDREERKYIEIN